MSPYARRYWTQAEDQRLLRLYHDGLTLSEIGRRLKRSAVSVDGRLYRLGVIRYRPGGPKRKPPPADGGTLCWACARAAGPRMCCWALEFTPVPGWEAERTLIKTGGEDTRQLAPSYLVRACPLYEEG